jgi:acyl dehydratase
MSGPHTSLDPNHVGRKYGPFMYELGLEKMREFAFAVGGGNPGMGATEPPPGLDPVLFDVEAGKRSRYGSVIAFPSFAVVFAIRPFTAAAMDPALGLDLLMLVHGEQELEFFDVMRPGDVMTTRGEITQIYEKAGKDFLTVVTESTNQTGKLVVRGTWTAVIRH